MPRKTTPLTAVMNTEEAARYVGLSASTLEKLRLYSENGPPFVTLGSTIRYRITDLDAWLARNVARSIRERDQRRRAKRGRGRS